MLFIYLGPTILAPSAPIGIFVFRNCATVAKKESRVKSCNAPIFFVCASAPQLPLNAFLNPFSTMRFLKILE